jgi:ribosome-binding ATPase YchF (GTP1/OBG family)
VVDERVELLNQLFKPKKTTYAKIEYLLPPQLPAGSSPKSDAGVWGELRVCDGLLHVIRNFQSPGGVVPTPEEDYWRLEEEMILNDLVVAEKRIERLDLDRKRGKKPEGREYELIQSCRDLLEKGKPLRSDHALASKPALKGFTFLSAKPTLVILNNEDEDESLLDWNRQPEDVPMLLVRGRLEMDIASMSPDEAKEFIELYHIEQSAMDRFIMSSFELLSRISFFTVISDEVRAWPILAGSPALEAAGTVHSDMQKGFIRAEVLSFEDLKTHGTFQEAKKAGVVRLEGKEYEVKDGDIINFRFNI